MLNGAFAKKMNEESISCDGGIMRSKNRGMKRNVGYLFLAIAFLATISCSFNSAPYAPNYDTNSIYPELISCDIVIESDDGVSLITTVSNWTTNGATNYCTVPSYQRNLKFKWRESYYVADFQPGMIFFSNNGLPWTANTITTNILKLDIAIKVTYYKDFTAKYVLFVTKETLPALSSDAGIDRIDTSLGISYNAGIYNYATNVPYTTANVTISPTVSTNTTYPVSKINQCIIFGTNTNYANTVRNSFSKQTNLAVGLNNIVVYSISQDQQTTNTYTYSITREAPSSYARLSSISVSGSLGTLIPALSTSTFTYNYFINYPGIVNPIYFYAYSNGTVNPSGDSGYRFDPGSVISLTVTAEDGITTQGYTITIVTN